MGSIMGEGVLMHISVRYFCAPALVLGFLVGGCSTTVFKHTKGTTYGEIMVGDARVSSRERLVNDRLMQDAWLKDELKRSDDQVFGFQGATDLRSFVGSSTRLEVNANPIEIDRFRAQAAQSADASRRQQEQDELDNQLLRQYKQRQLEAIAQQPSSAFVYTPQAGKPEVPSTPAAPTGPSVVEDMRTLKDDAGKVTIDPSSIKIPDKLRPSPQELLRDKLEYRGLIRTEMLENALDDRHDLNGNTMLRFDLDAAVRPENDTSAWAIINVEVDSSKWKDACIKDELYKKWVTYLESELRERAFMLNRNGQEAGRTAVKDLGSEATQIEKDKGYLSGIVTYIPEHLMVEMQRPWREDKYFNAPYWVYIFERINERLKANLQDEYERNKQRLESKEKLMEKLSEDDLRVKNERIKQTLEANEKPMGKLPLENRWHELNRQIYFEILAAQKRLYEGMFFEDKLPVFFTAELTVKDNTFLKLNRSKAHDIDMKFCEELHNRSDMYAYAITPKETVQRVSEVASRRNVSEFMLSLSFLAGNSAAGKIYSDYMKVSEGIFQAIHRQPLVVGFNNGTHKALKNPKPVASGPEKLSEGDEARTLGGERFTSFGWMLGPRFGIKNDGNGSHYRHTVAFNTLSSVLSIPGWLNDIEFKVKTHWVNDDGFIPAKPIEKTIPVRLKPDFTAITELLTTIREPRPFTRQVLKYDEGAAATFVIPGQNLWRNTVVLLGSQQADEVSVLPDMKGIVAKFKEIKLQRPKGSGEWEVLAVWTSEGRADAAYVKINPAKAAPSPDPIATLVDNNAAIGGNLVNIKLSPPLKSFFGISVFLPASKPLSLRPGRSSKCPRPGRSSQSRSQIPEDEFG